MKKKAVKRILTLALAVVLMSSLSATAFATDYDIGIESIEIEDNVVTKGTKAEVQSDPSNTDIVIVGTTTTNTVTITATNTDTEVTFKDVNINITENENTPVDITATGSVVTLNFEGNNTIKNSNDGSAINVNTISDGDKEPSVKLVGEQNSSLDTSAIVASYDTNTLSVENMELDCTAIGMISNLPESTLSIENSTVNAECITAYVAGQDEQKTTCSLEISNSTVNVVSTEDTFAEIESTGIIAANLDARENDEVLIHITNSDISVETPSGDPAIFAGADDANVYTDIILEESKLISPANAKIERTSWGSTGHGTSILNADGSIATSVKIVRDPSSSSTTKENQLRRLTVIENEDGSFTIQGAKLEDFVKMLMDNKLVENDTENFVLTTGEKEDELHLAFSESFLKDLTSGEHPVYMLFNGAYAQFNLGK